MTTTSTYTSLLRPPRIVTTKHKLPGCWERGGQLVGEAEIITGPSGEPLKPVFTNGTPKPILPCGKHALFILEKGFWAIKALSVYDGVYVVIFQVEQNWGELVFASRHVFKVPADKEIPEDIPEYLEVPIKKALSKLESVDFGPIYYARKKAV